jgi:adenylate cyclase
MGFGVSALGVLGEGERTKEWIDRALLIDPDNLTMRYNFACTLATHLKDASAALEMLGDVLAKATPEFLAYVKLDPDLDPIREDPRLRPGLEALAATDKGGTRNPGGQVC